MTRYVLYQVDRFTPPQEINIFNNKEEAEKELSEIENESIKYDAFTCFYIEEVER